MNRPLALYGLVFLLVSGAGQVAAGPDPTAKCTAAKLKAAGKKYDSKAKCHAKAILKNEPVSAECLLKAETKFNAAFAKADAHGSCLGDASSVESGVDTCLADLITDVVPDLDPPTLLQAAAGSANAVQLTFDEPIDPASVPSNGSSFTISGGINVVAAQAVGGVLVVLTTSPNLVSGNHYTVTVSGVTDVAGNVIVPPGNTAMFTP
jgi:Big-like domain-containing protein